MFPLTGYSEWEAVSPSVLTHAPCGTFKSGQPKATIENNEISISKVSNLYITVEK